MCVNMAQTNISIFTQAGCVGVCRESVAQGLQQDSSVGGHWLRACSKTAVSEVTGSGLAARQQCRRSLAQGLQQDSSVRGHWLRACSKTAVSEGTGSGLAARQQCQRALAQGLQQDSSVGG